MRIDEKTIFEMIELVSGEKVRGEFRIVRLVGDLGYAGELVVVNEKTGFVYPLRAVKRMKIKRGDKDGN